MAIKAEYIWIDGTEPTPQLRSKTKVISDDSGTDLADMPIWGFDGSSTNQATGDKSDCVLKPARVFPDPIRGGENVLVMCEVMLVDGKAHPTNTRAAAARTAKKYKKHEPMFGIEQEYTMLKPNGNPLGFPDDGFPAPQGPYYCGVGEMAIHRPQHRRRSHGRLPRCRRDDLGHQRRGHARTVGIPGRPRWPA